MPNKTKIPLSGSTNGRGIVVTATLIASGVTVHQAVNSAAAGDGDTVVLDIYNTHATVVQKVVIGWGGTSDPGDLREYTIPVGGWVRVEGFLNNNLVIKAATSNASAAVIWGHVLRAQ